MYIKLTINTSFYPRIKFKNYFVQRKKMSSDVMLQDKLSVYEPIPIKAFSLLISACTFLGCFYIQSCKDFKDVYSAYSFVLKGYR